MSQIILFSGHMIDRPGRLKPSFTEQGTSTVTREILKQLTEIDRSKSTLGLAGGACGGDIIFHELCMSLGIATEIYLPKSINEFKHESVAYAGNSWIERFDRLLDNLPFKILDSSQSSTEINVWQQANTWMINDAMKMGNNQFTLMALWDHEKGDGKGGTADIIDICSTLKQKIKIIDL